MTDDKSKKEHIYKIFRLNFNVTNIDIVILQCTEDFTKCIFYYDCNIFDIKTDVFIKCVENISSVNKK